MHVDRDCERHDYILKDTRMQVMQDNLCLN